MSTTRYTVDVVENIATSGFGLTNNYKYRWSVTDNKTGHVLKVGYAFSVNGGQQQGNHYVTNHLLKNVSTKEFTAKQDPKPHKRSFRELCKWK